VRETKKKEENNVKWLVQEIHKGWVSKLVREEREEEKEKEREANKKLHRKSDLEKEKKRWKIREGKRVSTKRKKK